MICANVLPVQHTRIPWGWKNATIDSQLCGKETYVIEPKGDLEMPDLCSYFDWSNFIVEGLPSIAPLGTRNYKSIFTTAVRLLGFERLLIELPDLTGVADKFLEWNEELLCCWHGHLGYFFIGDDFAGNNGLFMDPDVWRSWLGPYYRKMIDLGHEGRCDVIFHSDGDIYDILPDLSKMGVEYVSYEAVGRMKNIGNKHMGMRMIPVEDQKQTHANSMRLQR